MGSTIAKSKFHQQSAIKSHQLHQNLFEERKKKLDDLNDRLIHTHDERDDAQDSL
jgi:hypothetical protein